MLGEVANALQISTIDIMRWCVIFIIVLSSGAGSLVLICKRLKQLHETLKEKEEAEEARNRKILDHEEQINKLLENDDKTAKSIDEIKEIVNNLVLKMDNKEKRDNKSKRASYKDQIGRLYRYCSSEKRITTIQLDTLKDLIDDYEDCGGMNSFIHTKVEPEMYTWEVIDSEIK